MMMDSGEVIYIENREPSDLSEIKMYIKNNDIDSFREAFQSIEFSDFNDLIVETIRKEKKECFDIIMDKLDGLLQTDPITYKNVDYYEQCFAAVVHCSNPYFISKLIEVNRNTEPTEKRTLLHIAAHFENEIIAHHLVLNGANVNALDIMGTTPLEEAILCNNLEIVCMLLYYGACASKVKNYLTPFMYSLICKSSEDIQRILLNYETNFNLVSNGMSTLFFAIDSNSPVILDIIDQGADINYYSSSYNAISLAIASECNPEVFRILWENFNYKVWKITFSKSVLLKFFQNGMTPSIWREYLKIFMENESKLRLDLEHHRGSSFFESDLLVSNLYLHCLHAGVPIETTESYVLHLLSHGAHIFTKDIDIIYRSKQGVYSPFLDLLLYMDLHNNDDNLTSFMYFKYSPVPDLESFLLNVAIFPNALLTSLKKLRSFSAFSHDLQMKVLDIIGTEDPKYKVCEQIFNTSKVFPSLLQLSRNSARKEICLKYNVKNSCNLHTVIKSLDLPKSIKNILLFNNPIYFYS